MKRKNSVLKGALMGLGAGMLAGAIVGLASGDDPVMSYPADDPYGIGSMFIALNNAFAMTAGQKAVLGAMTLGTTGAIIGTVIGAVAHKKFIIGGRKERFHDLQNEVMLKLVKK
jgi:hypothetical protein